MTDVDVNESIRIIINTFYEQSSGEFKERISLWKTDFSCNETHEVI